MIEQIVHNFSLGYGLLALAVGYTVFYWWRAFRTDREIKALGGRPPMVKAYLPFGIDFLYRALSSTLTNRNLDFWAWMMTSTGVAARGSYTVETTLGSNIRVLLTADPENIKAILATQFHDFGHGEHFHQTWIEFLGDSIFVTDGEQWHASRQLLRPMFIRERVADLGLFETQVRKLITLLGPGDGREIDVSKLLLRYALDAATDFLLGKSVDSLDNPQVEFAEAFGEVQRIQSILERSGPLKTFIPRGRLRRGLKIMDNWIQPFIDHALSLSPAEVDPKLSKSDTFLHALARFTRDPKVIRDNIVAVLLAGRDTTAATLSWVFFELSRRPHVVSKLRREILDRLGGDNSPPTYNDLKEMKYLNYIINETLRLYPVVPFNVRQSLIDTTLPRGGGPDGSGHIGLRKETSVGYSTLVVHRRRDLYPPISDTFPYDPIEWVPERWATWTPKAWQYIPFNGGPRICIGQQFAIVEMGYTLCRIMQEFESVETKVDLRGGVDEEKELKAEIVLTPANGVRVGFYKNPG